MRQDITDDEARRRGPLHVLYMDLEKTAVELADDDDGLFLTLTDPDVLIHFRLPRSIDAGGLVRKFGWNIVNAVPDVRAKTLGYRAEHNAHTGPGVRGPIER